MTDQTASAGDDTSAISDKEMNAYFESGGEEMPSALADAPSSDAIIEPEVKEVMASSQEKPADNLEAIEVEPNEAEIKSYKAMAHEEREKRKEIARHVQQMKEENEQLKNTFQKILAKAQEQQELEQQAKQPSFEDDPLAALKFENDKIKNNLADIQKFNDAQAQNNEMHSKQTQFMNAYRQKVTEFSNTTPDFKDAYNHLLQSRLAEHEAAGFSKEQAAQMLHEDEAAIVATALSQNVNPGERIYNLAKLRGYQGKAADQSNNNQQKMDALEKGLRASKSIGSVGSSSDERMSLEDIANMNDSDFAKVDWNKVLKMG